MFVQRTSSVSTPAHPEAHADYYRRTLHELIEIGMDLVRVVHDQAGTSAAAGDPAADAAAPGRGADAIVAFERLSRAIRRSIAMARRIGEPVAMCADAGSRRLVARRRILRDVEDAIQRGAADDGEGRALQVELAERMDGPELDDDIDHRPAAEIIVEICRDLGLATPPGCHPWKRRTAADIAALHARAGAPRRAPRARTGAPPDASGGERVDAAGGAEVADGPERFFHIAAPPHAR